MADEVDRVQAEWQQSRPDLDIGPAAVFVRVVRISRLLQQLTDDALRPLGIDRASFEVLSVVTRKDRPVSPSTIADELHITRAGTTKRVRQVEQAGLVTRERADHDARSVVIELTDLGQVVVEQALDTVQALEASLLAGLSSSGRASIERELRRLLAVVVDHARGRGA